MNQTWTERVDSILIPVGSTQLAGDLAIPPDPKGMVLFAHGSGSSRYSPRNRYVANILRVAGFATLLMDLLTPVEESIDFDRRLRFDLGLLAERLLYATDWLTGNAQTQQLGVGYFGASTGAAAALIAAVDRPGVVRAIVSRGGRPDLAGSALSRVRAPTLLIVGGNDFPVIGMNQTALAQLRVEKCLEIIPNATHLFEEPGTLAEVARLASQWFDRYLFIPASL